MNREEILDKLDSSREQILTLLEPLSDEALLQPGALGDWSIADLLAHMTAWESELVTALMKIDQGKKPSRYLSASKEVDAYNARRVDENRGRDLARIFSDYHQVRLKLEDWLESFSEKVLNDKKRFQWAKNRPLVDFIAEASYQHEYKHLPDIELFASQWLEERGEDE